jgi:macrolide transport system ATP-binding/permease protein
MTALFDSLWRDVRFGVRQLRATPVFSAGVVLCLALGIGATTIAFSWVDTMVLRPPPGVVDMPTLASIRGDGRGSMFVSVPEAEDWRRDARTVSEIALVSPNVFAVSFDSAGAAPRPTYGVFVSRNYFATLGVEPALGTTFARGADEADGPPTGVLASHRVWQRDLEADPNVVGRSLVINRRAFEIIGVLPKGFGGTLTGVQFEVFLPLNAYPVAAPSSGATWRDRSVRWLDVVARLQPGTSLNTADAEFRVLGERQAMEHPEHRDRVIRAVPLDIGWARHLGSVLWSVAALAGLLLLIVCANVANLLLVRASARARELSIRLSLGASRGRVLRQLTTESALLGLCGSVLGVALAATGPLWSAELFPATSVPLSLELGMNERVLLFAVAVTAATTMLFGIAPAVIASRVNLLATMKMGSRGSGVARSRLRDSLVVGQFALCLTALACGALFTGRVKMLGAVERGFRDAHGVLLLQTDMSFTGISDPAEWETVMSDVMEEVSRVPGVERVALGSFVPLGFIGYRRSDIRVDGYAPQPNESMRMLTSAVTPDYFELMRIPILAGRPIQVEDDTTAKEVAVVNSRFADEYSNGGSIIGRTITVDGREATVVGVVASGKYDHREIDQPAAPFVYVSFAQSRREFVTVHVRTRLDPLTFVTPVRAAIQRARRDLLTMPPTTLEEYSNAPLSPVRTGVTILIALGGACLILSALGLYAVIAYATTLRQRDTTIRMAIGASPGRIVTMILVEAFGLAGVGILAGAMCATAAVALMIRLVPALPSATPTSVILPALALAFASLVATALPAWRASRADLAAALRTE